MAVAAPEQTNISHITELVAQNAESYQAEIAAAQFIGRVLLEGTVSHEEQQPITSLYEAIHEAARGDEVARNMIAINARTDQIERTIKAGHVSEVSLRVNESGSLLQFGQSMESVQANSLLFASGSSQMLARTKAETRNTFRTMKLIEDGTLDDYYLLVVSRAADDMSLEEMKDAGFFTDTMTTMLQLTKVDGTDVQIETAYVAGKKQQDSPRHDKEAVEALFGTLGIDKANKSATQTLDEPVLIPKTMLKNGVIDLVKIYDDSLGGTTFFGREVDAEDYESYRRTCQDRELTYEVTTQQIVDTLIQEAQFIHSETAAVERLHQLSQDFMVVRAITDTTIDARVFGPGAEHINKAREALQSGDDSLLTVETKLALQTAQSDSCPKGGQGGEQGSSEEDQYGSLEFDCPFGHKNKRPHGQLIPNCQTCGTSVRC